jgi:hypothetical protein
MKIEQSNLLISFEVRRQGMMENDGGDEPKQGTL